MSASLIVVRVWWLHLMIVTCLAAFSPTLSPASRTSLKFVAVVTRHGSRSPLSTFPNDPYPYTDNNFWPNGPGELTNLGKAQLYHTGQYLRARYRRFLDPIYRPNSSEVTYNPYNRDYMSSACLTAGLYPPVGPQMWDSSLIWQPVVQSVREFDICDLSSNNMCPKFIKLYNEEIKKFNEDTEKYNELLDYVSKNAGKNYTVLYDMYDVYDTLLMQMQNGFKLPQWTKQVFPFQIRPLAVTAFAQSYTGSKELVSLGAGPELKYISDMLNLKANGSYSQEKKLYIEAAHDCTLLSLLRAMGNNDQNLEIQIGAYIVFELHCLDPDYIVQTLFYRTPYDEKPEHIDIEDCPSPCSLENFNKFVDSINPPDYNQACQI